MRKIYLELAEKSFAILGLTFFTGAFDIGLTLPTGPLFPGLIRTAVRYFVWVTSLSIICIDWKNALRIANREKLLWILTTIIFLSFLWSDIYSETLRNNREVLQMTSFGLYFATRFSLKEQVKLVALTFSIGALLSLFSALVIPTIAIHAKDHNGAWRGIYDYKNTLGAMMIINSLALFLLPIDNPRHRIYQKIGIAISLLMILLCTSRTSLVVCLILALILSFYRNFRWRGKITVLFLDIGILIMGCVGTLVISNWATLITSLGRDPTLTGRTLIWNFIFMKLEDRPWLGYGRSAFWSHESKYAAEAGETLGYGLILPHAHNGFIDIILDIGYIGLFIFIIIYFTAFIRSVKRAYATNNPEDLWPLGFLIFLAMNNMTESYLLRLSNIYWTLFIAVVLSVQQTRSTSNLISKWNSQKKKQVRKSS
ncbi:O-antigen ligase family protein [Komarekiella sp. 'clone 1']|uniref:O-antigen ligase family protein n=1 Tax=Komarekiella delphini-convector SJRDD-AB1 TaxID=2593771 RepID=A0AA40T3F4_9NOST|nr:O-antigen ligase [Komarekiella delphini-convector]MBD6619945.1 O-antigen ligase family protein [Komarekiella delphini-convector SJRDD-AB1]